MDYIQAQDILANQNDFIDQPNLIIEAKKIVDAKETKTDIKEDEADIILSNPEDFADQPELIERAKEYKRMNAPGEAWARKYFPVKPGGGFDFNWRQYANDSDNAEDIEKKRLAAMWDLGDKVDLRDVAVDMRFKNKNEKWEDFIKSDRFPEFRNFLKDVAKYQQNKALDKIWNDDSAFIVDFGLPIAKEYARKNYETIPTEEGLNLAGLDKMKAPLIADFATNAAMAGAGKVASKVGNAIAKDAIEYAAAPAIGAVSDAIINDKGMKDAIANTFLGYGANKVTPNILGTGFRWFNYGAGKTMKGSAKRAVDEAVNAYEKNKNMLIRDANGGMWDYSQKKIYVPKDKVDEYKLRRLKNSETENFQVIEKDKMPTNKISVDSDVPLYGNRDFKEYLPGFISENVKASRKDKITKLFKDLYPFNAKKDINAIKRYTDNDIKEAENILNLTKKQSDKLPNKIASINIEEWQKKLNDMKMMKDLEERFEKSALTASDVMNHPNEVRSILRYHGIKDKESIYNYLKRMENGTIKSYFENVWGSSPQAQRQVERTLKAMIPQNVYDFTKDEEKEKKSLMEKIYGIN
jgi:hypothetical protein